MGANYYRMSLRFEKEDTKTKLRKLQREIEEKANKKVPLSRVVEGIVEQFFDKHPLDEEKE